MDPDAGNYFLGASRVGICAHFALSFGILRLLLLRSLWLLFLSFLPFFYRPELRFRGVLGTDRYSTSTCA